MPDSENYRKGAALRQQLMGGYAEKMNQTVYSDPMMQQFRDLSTEAIFGTMWTRPGLDLKSKALAVVAADVATAADEITIHLRIALNQGWTEQELAEAILLLTGYVGAPRVRQALLRAKDVFEEVRAQRTSSGS